MSTAIAPEPHPADAVASALRRRDPRLAQAVLAALVQLDAPDDLDAELWGPAPSDDEYVTAVVRNHEGLDENRKRVLRTSLSRRQAAERLDVSTQQVSRLVESGDLVALEAGRELRLPGWQFHPDSPKGRLDGIRELSAVFAGGPVTLTAWVTRTNPALGGRSPAEALVAGRRDRVIAAAAAAT